MRYRLGFLLAVAVIVPFSLGESEAACRAGGEYRLTGPNSAGYATFTETASGELVSSGIVVLNLFPKRACSVCSIGSQPLTGEYHAGPSYDGCILTLRVRDPLDPVLERTGSLDGMLAFGGAVILFDSYEFLGSPAVDLNLTLGIRSDSILRP